MIRPLPAIVYTSEQIRIAVWEAGNPANTGDVKISLYSPAFGTSVPYVHVTREQAVEVARAILAAL